MKIVFAPATVSITTEHGAQIQVREGSHWRADDPIVLAHPGLFSDDPKHGLSSSGPRDEEKSSPVEQTTANPGTVRQQVRRG